MSRVRSGWHEEEVNGGKVVVDCLSLLWLHDHDGLLSGICSAILSLGFHCTNCHQMFTFNKNVFVVGMFPLQQSHSYTSCCYPSKCCCCCCQVSALHLTRTYVFVSPSKCCCSGVFSYLHHVFHLFKWFLLQPVPPPTSCSCLGTYVCRIESPLYLKPIISLAKTLDQFLLQMLMLQWSPSIFLFRPWWGLSWNPNWVLFLHSHLLSFDNGVIISGTQRSTNQRLWSTGFTTAKMLTLWIGSSFWTLTKSYDTHLLPGRLELRKADLWQLNMGE
jgi:hypothetical protein